MSIRIHDIDKSYFIKKKSQEGGYFINFSLLLCTFLAFAKIPLGFFDLYYYYFIILLIGPYLFIGKSVFPVYVSVIFFLLLFIGLTEVFLGNNTLPQFIKTWGSTFGMYLFYFLILKYYRFNFSHIFTLYLNGAFWVSVLGLFQIVAFYFGLSWGYDYSWLGLEGVRSFYGGNSEILGGLYPVHSIYSEPAHFGCGIAPASFVALFNLLSKKKIFISQLKGLTILLAMIFTTATTSYFALFCSLIIIILNTRGVFNFLLALISTPILFYKLFTENIKFQNRLQDFVVLFQNDKSLEALVLTITGSSRVLINNTIVAIRNVRDHPIFGTGLGSHATAYFKYSIIPESHEDFGLNYNDANSLFNRLLSETGLIGIAALMLFLICFRINKKQNLEIWVINSSCLVMILSFLLRQGHYFASAFPLFVLMYYFSKKVIR